MELLKHGSDYGSWSLPKNSIDENSIIYSFGIGEDISFDTEIINKYNPHIYLFDPTPRAEIFFNKIKTLSISNDNFYDNDHKFNYCLNDNMFNKTTYNSYGLSNTCKSVEMFFPSNDAHVSLSEYKNGKSEKSIILNLKDLHTIMSENNHTYIDVLKMDIEGSEFDVIDFILDNNIDIKYLLIEFHYIGKDITYYINKLKKYYNISYTYMNDYGFIKK